MTCSDFRRLAFAKTEGRNPSALAHAAGCPACRRLAESLRAEDEALGRALAVPIPAGLADRVLLAQKIRRPRAAVWALATGAAIAACIAALFLWQEQVGRSIADEMIAHVVAEPKALAAAERTPSDRLTDILGRVGLVARTPLGDLRYAHSCKMRGGVGQHLVIETPQGKVTVIIAPPGQNVLTRRHLARAGYHAQVVPGRGSAVGLIGPDQQVLRSLAAVIEKS